MTNLTLDVNIIDFPSIPVAMLPHRCSPELLTTAWRNLSCGVKRQGLSPVNQSQTFGVAWDDPATTAPEAFRFDICGSVSEPIPDNRYGVSNGELPVDVMPWPATLASWTIFHTRYGHHSPLAACKRRENA
ncbi:GyrI-like domain-containing protein [Escherichia coli]